MTYSTEKVEFLVKDFNDFIEKKFNETIFTEDYNEEDEEVEEIDQQSTEFIYEWEHRIIPEIGDVTPVEYFEGMSTLEDTMKVFRYFSINSIDEIPPSLIMKIYSFGPNSIEVLAEELKKPVIGKNITDFNELSDEDICDISVITSTLKGFKLLEDKAAGIWSNIVDLINNCNENNELFLEAGQEALSSMGNGVLTCVAKHIDNTNVITNREEYLLMALSSSGYVYGNDDIYSCLRNSFKRMDDKVIGANILSDYGDGRAVTLLRRYAKEDAENMDEGDYLSILAAIDNLGGDITDLLQYRNITKR